MDRCQGAHISNHDSAVLNRIFNPNLPYDDNEQDEPIQEIIEEDTESIRLVKELELAGVKAAESGDSSTALDFFNQAIDMEPNRASGYNNRAQALRLKGDTEGALQDLAKCIDLSQGRGNAAVQAYVQRALLHKLQGDDEKALQDFKVASNLGSSFAKQQIVLMNPYAAMCNQMLTDVLHKMRAGLDY